MSPPLFAVYVPFVCINHASLKRVTFPRLESKKREEDEEEEEEGVTEQKGKTRRNISNISLHQSLFVTLSSKEREKRSKSIS